MHGHEGVGGVGVSASKPNFMFGESLRPSYGNTESNQFRRYEYLENNLSWCFHTFSDCKGRVVPDRVVVNFLLTGVPSDR
jgi:hypothetical protein